MISLLNYLRCAVIMWLLIRKKKCITDKEEEPFIPLDRFGQSRNELINFGTNDLERSQRDGLPCIR